MTQAIGDLLAEATAAGVIASWTDDGGLYLRGGTAELRRSIGTRKDELGSCLSCRAVMAGDRLYCEPCSAELSEWLACGHCGAVIVRTPDRFLVPACPECGSQPPPVTGAAERPHLTREDGSDTAVIVLTPPVLDGPMFTTEPATTEPETAVVVLVPTPIDGPLFTDSMRCASCFTAQLREWGSLAECTAPGCGNRVNWITTCRCGLDAAPGAVTCMSCT